MELTKAEKAELKKLTRRIRTQRATFRELLRAIDLTNRDHKAVRDMAVVPTGFADKGTS
jgi:hypothetical protein